MHPLKTWNPSVSIFPKSTFFKFVQFSNALCPISFTVFGIVISVIPVFAHNFWGTIVNPSSNVIFVMFGLSKHGLVEPSFIVFGIVTSVIPVTDSKALLPIEITVLPSIVDGILTALFVTLLVLHFKLITLPLSSNS